MKLVIAGGSGYLGRLVARYFGERGWEIITLARGELNPGGVYERVISWDGLNPGPWVQAIAGVDVWLNLAGRTVNCRYSKKNRGEILESRVQSTRVLGNALRALRPEARPRLWLNSSTATIYRHAEDRAQDEASGELGKGFSVEIAKAWEEAFFSAAIEGTRMVALRSAMVFGPGADGVYGAFAGLARLRLGGRHGSGQQFVSWIHHEDFCRALDWIIGHEELTGPVNLAAPGPLRNREFQRALRKSLGVSLGVPSPEWLLEIGAFFKRTETELLLKSRRVVPGKLVESGFRFQYQRVEEAFRDLATK